MTITPPICPYCGAASVPATGEDIYPHRRDLFEKKFFWCEPCDAYVGTHNRTNEPFGTLADAYLRKLRSLTHATFDRLWKEEGYDHIEAYLMLAQGMNIPFESCHIAMFNNAQCRRAVDLVNSKEIYRYDPQRQTRPEDKAGDQEKS